MGKTMKIESPRFGTLEVEPSKIIDFPDGLPGFEELRRFTLFHPEGQAPMYFILQSVDDPAVAFHVADPSHYGFNFEIALSDEETATLALKRPEDLAVVVMLVEESGGKVRANLKAPLVINLATKRGLQHVFSRLNYDVTGKAS
jgi:flagellar assembly factor FliW